MVNPETQSPDARPALRGRNLLILLFALAENGPRIKKSICLLARRERGEDGQIRAATNAAITNFWIF